MGGINWFSQKDENGNATTSMEEVIKTAEKFYTELYSDKNEKKNRGVVIERIEMDQGIPKEATNQVNKPLQRMGRGKTGLDCLTPDLIKDAKVISKLDQICKENAYRAKEFIEPGGMLRLY